MDFFTGEVLVEEEVEQVDDEEEVVMVFICHNPPSGE